MIIPGPAQLGIIAIIVALVFGTKRLREVGGDIGGMFKGIKDGFREARTAADEIGPEIHQLTDDVRALRRTGRGLVQDPLSRGAEVGHNMGPYGDDY